MQSLATYLRKASGEFVSRDVSEDMAPEAGVFTTFVAVLHKPVFCLEEHYQRLKRDADFFHWPLPWTDMEAFKKEIEQFITSFITQPVVMRVSVVPFQAEGNESLSLQVMIHLRALPQVISEVKLKTVQFDRAFCEHKHLSRITDMQFLQQVQQDGFDDFLRISTTGYLTETAYMNVFLLIPSPALRERVRVRGYKLITPCSQKAGCLPGIMRGWVMAACQKQGIFVEEGCYTPDILSSAQGLFVTNAVRGIIPVSQVDDMTFDVDAIQSLLKQVSPHSNIK